jgi:acyl dehydratase
MEKHIGFEWPPFTVRVEREQAKTFATALGETNAIYFDEDAARAAGYAGLPVLPTYVTALANARTDLVYDLLERLNADPSKVLHGSQRYVFHAPIYAGDELVGRKQVTNVVEKKGGALLIIETRIDYRGQRAGLVFEDHCTLVVRR